MLDSRRLYVVEGMNGVVVVVVAVAVVVGGWRGKAGYGTGHARELTQRTAVEGRVGVAFSSGQTI